jgi:hypothetical protein
MAIYSTTGIASVFYNTSLLHNYWKQQLELKEAINPAWNIDLTLEFYDVHSNPAIASEYLIKRLSDETLPQVSAIIGPEGFLRFPSATIAQTYNTPIIITRGYPSIIEPSLDKLSKPTFGSAFFTNSAVIYQWREAINAYAAAGVKTIVAVAAEDPMNVTADYDSCWSAADLAESKGMTVLTRREYYLEDGFDVVQGIVNDIRDIYKPDAVIWCGMFDCVTDSLRYRNPLYALKAANYLPKALSVLNCLDEVSTTIDSSELLRMYDLIFFEKTCILWKSVCL